MARTVRPPRSTVRSNLLLDGIVLFQTRSHPPHHGPNKTEDGRRKYYRTRKIGCFLPRDRLDSHDAKKRRHKKEPSHSALRQLHRLRTVRANLDGAGELEPPSLGIHRARFQPSGALDRGLSAPRAD